MESESIESLKLQALKLFEEGAGAMVVSRILSVPYKKVAEWKSGTGNSITKSFVYPLITEFTEKRLREAAEQGMDVHKAAEYVGISKSRVKGFWRRIGHNYITPEQEEKILFGLGCGEKKSQIIRRAGLRDTDLDYFLHNKKLKIDTIGTYAQDNQLEPRSADA